MGWDAGDPYVGLNTASNQFWIHVRWNSPQHVRFQFNEAQADTDKLKDEVPSWELAPNGKWERQLDLLSEDVYFFSRIKKHQVDELAKFIKEAYDSGTRCVKTP